LLQAFVSQCFGRRTIPTPTRCWHHDCRGLRKHRGCQVLPRIWRRNSSITFSTYRYHRSGTVLRPNVSRRSPHCSLREWPRIHPAASCQYNPRAILRIVNVAFAFIECTVRKGQTSTFEVLLSELKLSSDWHDRVRFWKLLSLAADRGNVEITKTITGYWRYYKDEAVVACQFACKRGRFALVCWLFESYEKTIKESRKVCTTLLSAAIESGSYKLVQKFLVEGVNADNQDVVKAAFRSKNIQIHQLLLHYGATITQTTLNEASQFTWRSSMMKISPHPMTHLMFRYAIVKYKKMFSNRFGLTMLFAFEGTERIVENDETLR
jgi:hypothetical protein